MVKGALIEDEVKELDTLLKCKIDVDTLLAAELWVYSNTMIITFLYKDSLKHRNARAIEYDMRKIKKVRDEIFNFDLLNDREKRVELDIRFKAWLSEIRSEGRVGDLVTTKVVDFFLADQSGEKDSKKLEHYFISKGVKMKIRRDLGTGHLEILEGDFTDYLLR